MEPFDHETLAENILAGIYLVLALGIPAAAIVRLLGALCSQRIRSSVARHPWLHAAWFLAGLVLVFDLLSVFSVNSKG